MADLHDQIEAILARSRTLNRERRHRESEELMRTAIQRYPFCAEILLQAAATFLVTAPDATAALAHRAARTRADDPTVLFRAAHLLFAIAEVDASAEYLARVQALMPPDFPLVVDVIHLAGKHALHRGDLGEAERALAVAFDRAPESNGHGEVLAKLYDKQGKKREAYAVVRRARAYRPDDSRLIALERELNAEC